MTHAPTLPRSASTNYLPPPCPTVPTEHPSGPPGAVGQRGGGGWNNKKANCTPPSKSSTAEQAKQKERVTEAVVKTPNIHKLRRGNSQRVPLPLHRILASDPFLRHGGLFPRDGHFTSHDQFPRVIGGAQTPYTSSGFCPRIFHGLAPIGWWPLLPL